MMLLNQRVPENLEEYMFVLLGSRGGGNKIVEKSLDLMVVGRRASLRGNYFQQ